MNIFGYKFKGPYDIGEGVIDKPAVYIVVSSNDSIVDVDQAGKEGASLVNHKRKDCWEENKGLQFYVAWMPLDEYKEKDREMLVNQIRETIDYIPCGEK